jgi:hypothetical protein
MLACLAPAVDDLRLAGLTDNPRAFTPALRADGRRRFGLRHSSPLRFRRGRFSSLSIPPPCPHLIHEDTKHYHGDENGNKNQTFVTGLSACRQFAGRCAYEEVWSAFRSQAVEVSAKGGIAFARRGFQTFSVNHGHAPMRVANQSSGL